MEIRMTCRNSWTVFSRRIIWKGKLRKKTVIWKPDDHINIITEITIVHSCVCTCYAQALLNLQNESGFYVPPNVELLDLAGPFRFYRSQMYGLLSTWVLRLYGWNNKCCSLDLARLQTTKSSVEGGIFCSSRYDYIILQVTLPGRKEYFSWIGNCSKDQVTICSICNGAFVLAKPACWMDKSARRIGGGLMPYKFDFQSACCSGSLYVKSGKIYTTQGSARVLIWRWASRGVEGAPFVHKVAVVWSSIIGESKP